MAEEKDFMKSQDFLGDLTKNVSKSTGSGLFEKLSANARQEALQPLTKLSNIKSFTQPFIELKNKAETAQKAGLAAYIAANPEIDESLLYDGTGDIVNSIMQENNLKFREINRQLSFMDIRNPKYQELANELNKINTTSAQLREDNKKLLGIRNLMRKDNRVQELTKGMSESMLDMYTEIQNGDKTNFVNIDGKLHWKDPKDPNKDPVAISSLDAAGPTYTNSIVMTKHAELYDQVINAQFVDDAVLHTKINNLWSMDGIKESGLKSFIFDNQEADVTMGFNTSDWFNSWYEDQGIDVNDKEAVEAEYERIRNGGVLVDGSFTEKSGKKGNVKKHFSAWYHSKMKEKVASQYNKIQAAKKTETTEGVIPLEKPKPLPTGSLNKKLLPKLNDDAVYVDQTGTGEQFGIAKSPFAGITQKGWQIATNPATQDPMSKDDHLFEFGDDDFVINTLNREYSKYGFEFTDAGYDVLRVKYTNPAGEVEDLSTFEFDNKAFSDRDDTEAERLQKAMHLAAGIPIKEEEVEEENNFLLNIDK